MCTHLTQRAAQYHHHVLREPGQPELSITRARLELVHITGLFALQRAEDLAIRWSIQLHAAYCAAVEEVCDIGQESDARASVLDVDYLLEN